MLLSRIFTQLNFMSTHNTDTQTHMQKAERERKSDMDNSKNSAKVNPFDAFAPFFFSLAFMQHNDTLTFRLGVKWDKCESLPAIRRIEYSHIAGAMQTLHNNATRTVMESMLRIYIETVLLCRQNLCNFKSDETFTYSIIFDIFIMTFLNLIHSSKKKKCILSLFRFLLKIFSKFPHF